MSSNTSNIDLSVYADFTVKGCIIDKLNSVDPNGGTISLTAKEIALLKDSLPIISQDTLVGSATATSGRFEVCIDADKKMNLLHREASANGFCFLWTLLYLNELCGVSFSVFERILVSFKGMYDTNSWPSEPLGKDVFVSLAIFKLGLQGMVIPGLGLSNPSSTNPSTITPSDLSNTIQSLMRSKMRFNFQDVAGTLHLERTIWSPCECTEIICNHGWSSTFIITAACTYGKRIGATMINLDDVFVNDSFKPEDTETEMHTAPLNLASGFPRMTSGFKVTNAPPPQTYQQNGKSQNAPEFDKHVNLSYDELASRYLSTQKELESLTLKVHRMPRRFDSMPGIPEIQEMKSPKIDDPSVEEAPIEPNDSSSNIGRYRPNAKHFMEEGTVFTVVNSRMNGVKTQESLVQYLPRDVPEVVKGFVTTESVAMRDNESRQKVKPINGLCNPFKNNRLNFLMHFFTALETLSGSTETSLSPYDLMKLSKSFGGRTPTIELLVLVVERTFDQREDVVISNPFNLPYIEIGMQLTDDCVVKSLSLLLKEYEILWFQEMKALKVPKFYKIFGILSEEKLSRSSKRDDGKDLHHRRNSSSSSDKSKRSSSIFSITR